MNLEIHKHKQHIDYLFTLTSKISDIEVQSNWAKYLCVLASGLIEESIRTLIMDFTKKNSHIKIRQFVESNTQGITNCKTNRILEILRKFDQKWADDFLNEIQVKGRMNDEIRDSIDSVIDNRHKIAHGKNVGLRISTINN